MLYHSFIVMIKAIYYILYIQERASLWVSSLQNTKHCSISQAFRLRRQTSCCLLGAFYFSQQSGLHSRISPEHSYPTVVGLRNKQLAAEMHLTDNGIEKNEKDEQRKRFLICAVVFDDPMNYKKNLLDCQ